MCFRCYICGKAAFLHSCEVGWANDYWMFAARNSVWACMACVDKHGVRDCHWKRKLL
jgi:hypothetical protein